jgi:hypothetical protein
VLHELGVAEEARHRVRSVMDSPEYSRGLDVNEGTQSP